jgi:uncharacterized protein (DUF302 family)
MRRFALLTAAALAASALIAPPASAEPAAVATATADGVLRQQSAHGFDETVQRLRADISSKGIPLFAEIDQTRLGAGANLTIRRSTLLLFGNPPLGVQFLQSNPLAGLDWPVRMLVVEDQAGQVWVAWTDFGFIARRYGIADREAQFAMASDVAASIASSAR